jgi:hypothetical protein
MMNGIVFFEFRTADDKFQWVHINAIGNISDAPPRFDLDHSDYVLKLDFTNQDVHARITTEDVKFVIPEQGGVHCSIQNNDGKELVSCTDLIQVQTTSYIRKGPMVSKYVSTVHL